MSASYKLTNADIRVLDVEMVTQFHRLLEGMDDNRVFCKKEIKRLLAKHNIKKIEDAIAERKERLRKIEEEFLGCKKEEASPTIFGPSNDIGAL